MIRNTEKQKFDEVIMILRKYKPSDCAITVRLFYDTVHTVNAKHYTNEQLYVWATGNVDLEAWDHSFLAHNTLIAEIEGTIVGFANMDNTGYLDKLYIHKDFQHKGIAYALVNELERRARNTGISDFVTYASITAKPFFERQGYMVEKENEAVREGIILLNYQMIKHG
jgi:putative acetyltransferase